MQEIDYGESAPGLHDTVIGLMENEDRGRLLDAPSGLGELSHLLKEKGFDVIAGDIDESVVIAPEVKFKKIDLNARLPFDDSSLDYVLNVEGVEHLENPHHTIREFTRIVKPGGKIILTTPNVLNVFSRLRYLLIGFHEYFGDDFSSEDNFYLLHINPVGFPEIAFALKKNNLEVEEIAMNQSVVFSRGVLMGLLLLILKFFIRCASRFKINDPLMNKTLVSPALLDGEILIVKCRKRS